MNENREPLSPDGSFEELKQKAKADSLKRQSNISMIIRELGVREQLKDKLDEGGIFLAGLSTLKEIDILYLIGACSSVERLTYLSYEKKYNLKKGEGFEGFEIYDENTGEPIELKNVRIKGTFKCETLLYEDVISFAENFGVSFDISHENLLLAKEIKRTAFLFEMLKTNVHEIKFPYQDGLPRSNWYDKTSYEESENKILQNLICLLNTLNIDDKDAKAFLNLLIYLRLFSHVNDLRFMAEKKDTDIIDSYRMKYTAEFFNHLIPTQLDFSSDERFILLYFAIQKTKEALQKYQDEEVSKMLLDWLNFGVKKFEEHIPDNFKRLEVSLPPDILNHSFYRSNEQEEMKEEEINEEIKENSLQENPKSLYDKIFLRVDDYIMECGEAQQKIWDDDMKSMDPKFHGIYKLAQLSDAYTFYALGIINEEDLSVLMNKIHVELTVKAVQILENSYLEYIDKLGEERPDLVQEFKVFQEMKQKKMFVLGKLAELLVAIGWEEEKINKLAPTTKEALTHLLQEDFDTYIPLALKFNKKIFDLVNNFREVSQFLTEKMCGISRFSLDTALPLETCVEKGNPDLTKMQRLMLCADILDAVEGVAPARRANKVAYEKILNLTKAYYLSTLQKIFELTDEEKQPEQAKRMKELYSSYDVFNVPVSLLEKEKEEWPFLLALTKLNLKSFSNSKATQNYYLDWFDYALDFSEAEKEEFAQSKIILPKYRRNPNLDDSLDLESQHKFLNNIMKDSFTQNDLEANHHDKRVGFSVCADCDLLYAMGVLSPFEYDKLGNKSVEFVVEKKRTPELIEVCLALQEENPSLRLPLIKEVIDVMEQIRLASRLLDYSYNYKNVWLSGLDYNKQAPETTVFDFTKNPLKAEGTLIDTMLMMMKDLREYNLEESKAMRGILNSYWKESAQQLNTLSLVVEKKYPEMAKRILDQRAMFGIRAIEEKETISNRFKYYPKLFSLMRQAIEKEYKCTGNLMKRQNFFEKEIKGFVSFYKKRAPILKEFESVSRERE